MATKSKSSPVRRTATFIAALGVLLASCGAALLLTATPANAAAEKYFVCKYVGTPGVDEILQTGQNPISTAAASIKADPIVVGAFFADDQGRSYVLAEDNTPPGPEGDPPVSQCPPPDGGNEEIAVDVVFTDPDCDNENTASYEVTGDTANVDVEESAAPAADTEVTVTATAKDGFEFAGGEPTYSETHTFGSAEDCTVVEPPGNPPPPAVEPPAEVPTVVHAGLISASAVDLRTQQGIALLAAGLLLMLAAGAIAIPRGARR